MTREIKFRVWSIKRKKFVGEEHSIMHFYNRLAEIHKILIMMEFIGIKDKDGKEIYEEDIIEVASIVYVVRYQSSKCRFALDDLHGNINDMLNIIESSIKYYKVIGNIHENPELLKEKKQ